MSLQEQVETYLNLKTQIQEARVQQQLAEAKADELYKEADALHKDITISLKDRVRFDVSNQETVLVKATENVAIVVRGGFWSIAPLPMKEL